MIKNARSFIYLFWLVCFWGCVKPYSPAVTTTNYNYLVVEGMINLSDSTFIKLSRTVPIGTATTAKPELKAVITIESNTGATYVLKELGNGVYATPSLNLSVANQYRLRVKTSNGNTYLSDFVVTTPSPPVDSVNWVAGINLDIYITTHDPNNATRYYRWDYSEEWQFSSDYDSNLISDGLNIQTRTPTQHIHNCWGGDTSHLVTLATSVALSSDVIKQQLINTIASTSEKLSIKYSILIKQYALTKDAYNYWSLLKKNTEDHGSIFDARPSASIGNIHNINNASEPVIGYISAGTIALSKRLFISKSQLLSQNWTATAAYPITATQCQLDTVPYLLNGTTYPQFNFIDFLRPDFLGKPTQLIPIDAIGPGLDPTVTVTASAPICVDCTLRGSVNKPAYWQ